MRDNAVPPEGDLGKLADAHIAEYNAITNRLTYWIYLQWALYAAAGTDLILIGELTTPYQAWLLFFVLLLIAWGVLYTQDEILSSAAYIEGRLKPAIWTLPGFASQPADTLWRWEEFLIEWRGTGLGKFEQHWGLVPVFLGGGLGLLLILMFRLYDGLRVSGVWNVRSRDIILNILWILVSAYLIKLISAKTKHNSKLRDELNRLIAENAKRAAKAQAQAAGGSGR